MKAAAQLVVIIITALMFVLVTSSSARAYGTDSCVGSCDGSGGDCWCDSYCTDLGDCCNDYQDVCASATGAGIGCIGDSMVTGFDADPSRCHDIGCFDDIGDTWNYSYCGGNSLSASVRNLRGQTLKDNVGFAGARLSDALSQAQALTANGCPAEVVLGLGGNDVMVGREAGLPQLSTLEAQLDAALDHLDAVCPNTTVALLEVPDVVQLYEVMHDQKTAFFSTSQDLWDLDLSEFNLHCPFLDIPCYAVQVAGWLLAPIANLIAPLFVDDLGDTFPGGYVLSSEYDAAGTSPATRRAVARQFNQNLNAMIASQAAAHGALFGDCIYEIAFDSDQVSYIDSFHPNTDGLALLGRAINDCAFNGTTGTTGSGASGAAAVSEDIPGCYCNGGCASGGYDTTCGSCACNGNSPAFCDGTDTCGESWW